MKSLTFLIFILTPISFCATLSYNKKGVLISGFGSTSTDFVIELKT